MLSAGVVHLVAQTEAKKKTKTTTIEEVFYISRDCPDDVARPDAPEASLHNTWTMKSVDDEKVVMSCTYIEYDEEKKQ
jgi:hypothetical protein